jgi:hypothetical protein
MLADSPRLKQPFNAGYNEQSRCGPRGLPGAAGGAFLIQQLFHILLRLAGSFLNPADQFVFLSFDVLKIAICQAGPFLSELALDDVPISLHL